MSRSLRLALAAVPPEADGAMILLADQPTLDAATLRSVLDAARGDRPMVAAQADGHVAPPVLLRADAFDLADEVTGDEGLRSILARHPELVTPVAVSSHAADVDTPADLERLGERCPGCHALFAPPAEAATHAYIGASAPCWAAFTELIAREFQDGAYGWVHRHSVDAYAAQHPGVDGRRQRQSVAVHLIGLCHWLEHGLTAAELAPLTQALTGEKREWPWLEPPTAYGMTVLDVLTARSDEEHATLVRGWAASIWEAWAPHHAAVRQWAADALTARR